MKLSPEVAAKYNLVTYQPGTHHFPHPFGVIDFTTITLAQADKLVENGFRFLVQIQVAPRPYVKQPAAKATVQPAPADKAPD